MPEDDRTDDLVRLVDDESASRVAGERHRGIEAWDVIHHD